MADHPHTIDRWDDAMEPTQRVGWGRPFLAGTTEPTEKSTSVTVA